MSASARTTKPPVIPAFAYHWLGTALLISAAPLVFFLSPIIWGACLAAVVWRWRMAVFGAECPGTLVRMAVLLVGAGAVAVFNGSLVGLAPGLEMLLILITVKFLEIRSRREFMLVTFLCFFLGLTTLFFQQSLPATAYVVAASLPVFGTAMRFDLGRDRVPVREVLLPIGRMAVQALPIVIMLFLFFPRSRGGFILRLTQATSEMGMSDTMNPGEFAQLSTNDEVAFRADFPDGKMPPAQDLFWRGVVFWECDNLHWSRGDRSMTTQPLPPARGARVTQRITMEPHGHRWMFALDHPVSVARSSRMMRGAFLETGGGPISKRPAPYLVESTVGPDATPMDPVTLRHALQLPSSGVSEEVRALVARWQSADRDPERVARDALNYFHKESFRYTTRPGAYSTGSLDEFLFKRRAGYCEHYAAAFSTLMRVAGIPARVVGGYRGGRYNAVGDYITVFQMDAHAWSEIWVEGKGWIRIDPTDAIDPSRVSDDISSRLLSSNENIRRQRQNLAGEKRWWGAAAETAALLWDNANYKWDLWIIGYDQDSQFAFYSEIGMREKPWIRASLLIVGGAGAILLLLWLAMRVSWQREDPVLVAYRKMCSRFASAGVPRGPSEGPVAYSERLRAAFPGLGGAIAEAFGAFASVRYMEDGAKEGRAVIASCRRLRPKKSDRRG